VVRRTTRITVTGCPKSKSKSRPRKSKSRGAHRPRKR
jgi:hypothetical protein